MTAMRCRRTAAGAQFRNIAVRRRCDGDIALWLTSGDNFDFLQQTVLLHFPLAD
jgi:hypothetical protein